MNILKKVLVGFMAGLMATLLLTLAWTSVGTATIRNDKVVKSWFDKSGFYTKVPDIVVDNLKNSSESNNDETEGVPASNPAIQKIIKDALSPEFLKTSIDTSLDSIYAWLKSDQQDLTFKLDLTTLKENIAKGLSDYAKNRSVGLPVCGAVGNNSPVEPFMATCLPRGVTPDQVGALASEQFLSQDFLKDPVITAENLKIKDENGNSVPITNDARAKIVRKVYHLNGALIATLGILVVLLSVGITFLSKNRLKGLRRVGSVFLSTGIVLGILYGALIYSFRWASETALRADAAPTAQTNLALDFVRVALNDVERILLIYAVVFVVLGIVAKVLAFVLKQRGKPAQQAAKSEEDETISEVDTTETPEVAPVERPTPKPPRKIQL